MRDVRTCHARRIRREDVIAGLIVAVFAMSVVLACALALIAQWFEPDGLLGRPGRIEACGGGYRAGQPARIWTRAEIDAASNQGVAPEVFEPVLGQIPIFAPLTGPVNLDGLEVCDTLVWLHVGPDAYVAYAREGGG